jgi:PLP dependent protein
MNFPRDDIEVPDSLTHSTTSEIQSSSRDFLQNSHVKITSMPRTATSIAANLERVRERIARAATRGDRRPEEIVVIAVSKTFPAQAIREAYEAGARAFGENRVQEWEAKQPLLMDLQASWHLVGHLQSNKARRASRLFDWIDSVDDIALATKLDEAAGETNEWLAVLIEVQVDPSGAKSGVAPQDLPVLAEAIAQLPHLQLRGLMTIPPHGEDPRDSRPYFRRLRRLGHDLQAQLGLSLPELSMGMSNDFEIAIEEGATQVRLGTAIFGERPAK